MRSSHAKLWIALAVVILAMLACAPIDDTTSPAATVEASESEQQAPPRGAVLRRDQVRTNHILAGAVTAPKLAVKSVAITVNAAASTGSSAADPDLVNGVILGFRQTGNQDQHVDNIVLNANGSVTVTLAANATANNTFAVVVAGTRGQF